MTTKLSVKYNFCGIYFAIKDLYDFINFELF